MKFVLLSKRGLLQCLLIAICTCAIISGIALTHSSGVFLNKPLVRKLAIHSVDTNKHVVSVSIVLDSDLERNNNILTIMDTYKVPYSIFVGGQNVEANADIISRYKDNDNVEFGTNGNTSSDHSKLKAKEIAKELESGSSMLQKLTGKTPILYKAPLDIYNDTLISTVQKEGKYPISSDISLSEYNADTHGDVAKKFISKLQNGSILSASASDDNLETILPLVVVGLQSLGYQIVKVGDLIVKGDYTIDNYGRQHKK